MNELLEKTFDLEETSLEVIQPSGVIMVPQDSLEKNLDYDYEKTRNNLHTLLEQGQQALFHALEVARQSEHPRAFEVVGNLIKQLADVNHQLLDLTDKRHKTLEKKEEKPTTQNNAFFVGSTAELNRLIRGE